MTEATATRPATRRRTTVRRLTVADLPLQVPHIQGETTASFLARTATANALTLRQLLKALHHGRLPKTAADAQARHAEVLLTPAALERLTGLVQRDAGQLAAALPHLSPGQLAEGEVAAVRAVAWPQEPGARPLPTCPLCAEDGAWLVPDGTRWRPCGCGRRWLAGDDGGYLINTTPVPELGRALARQRAIVDRLGPAGDALIADAHQVALWWWVHHQVAREVWRKREDALHVGPKLRRRQAAPAVVYPEALALAEAMDAWEQQRTRPKASPEAWLEGLAARFGVPGLAGGREADPLRYWLESHPAQPGRSPSPASRAGRQTPQARWEQLTDLHHQPGDETTHLIGRGPTDVTPCLRWVFGLPLTSVTELCPHCAGRAPSCRWIPAPDCPQRPPQQEAETPH
jgi:hypothetical protein